MSFTTNDLYEHDVYTVKRFGDHTLRVSYIRACRKAGFEPIEDTPKKGTVNSEKLSNNLVRAKSTVRELVLCNPWDYWCTFTVSPDRYDRYDLKAYFKAFGEFIHNYNRRCSEDEKVKYLLVPEQHKDGAWHLHGFIKGIRKKDLYTNQYGYLTWKQYEEKFGYISMSEIKDIDRASSYIMKYMTKEITSAALALNAHSFYSSKGLQRADELYRGHAIYTGDWDWEHEDGYCKVKTIDERNEDISEIFEVVE